jgi:monofunctional biosynthetic peptidoglycan transglycosylase
VKLGKRIGRIVGFALGVVVLVFVVVQAYFLFHIAYWTKVDPGRTSFMERRLDEMRARDPKAKLDQRWVEYRRISSNLKRAVIAAEDAKFVDQ